MKKLFTLVAMAAAISFAACTGNKAEKTAEEACDSTACAEQQCQECPVKAIGETLTAALAAGNAEEISNALKDAVAKAGELAKEGKTEVVDAVIKNVQEFMTTNEAKLKELGVALESIPAQCEEIATTAKESAEAAAAQAVEDVKDAAAEKVEEAKDAAAEKVEEAKDAAAEKVDEAAQKASDAVDKAASDAAAKTKEKLGL